MKHTHGGRMNEERSGDFDRTGTLSKEKAAHGHNEKQLKHVDSNYQSVTEHKRMNMHQPPPCGPHGMKQKD